MDNAALGSRLATGSSANNNIGFLIIALAIPMPVVASMGGIAGTQTLIIVTRGIATGRVTTANIKTLINKEVAVSGLNGIIWSIVIGLITYYWFADLLLSLIIALAIITNLVVAAFSGAFLPLLLSKLKIDHSCDSTPNDQTPINSQKVKRD